MPAMHLCSTKVILKKPAIISIWEIDLSTLVRYLKGLPNGQDKTYLENEQELLNKREKGGLIGAAQAIFASVNEGGRSRALAPAQYQICPCVVVLLVPCRPDTKSEKGLANTWI